MPASRWRRHLVYRTESIRTTWKLRLGIVAVVVLVAVLTRGLWTRSLARSLACVEEVGKSDAIVVENFEPNYLLFERAAALQRTGFASRVLVPTEASHDDATVPNRVSVGFVDVMAGVARVQAPELIVIREREPITLNAARQLRDFLVRQRLQSVIVVAPALRSRRSLLVHRAVLGPAGVHVYCAPVVGAHTPENWTATWHGVQEVVQQLLKLQYYRFYVLPLSPAG